MGRAEAGIRAGPQRTGALAIPLDCEIRDSSSTPASNSVGYPWKLERTEMQKLSVTLALAAGLLGGFVSRNITLPSVHAQAQPAAPVEIRAQRFTLVDDQDKVVGTFTFRGQGMALSDVTRPLPVAGPRPVVLLDPNGREIWSSQGYGLKLLSGGNLR